MINKQTVLQILEERKARLTDSLIDDALEVELDVLINKISNLPEEDGWVPCSERLPEERDWYLALFKEPDTDFVGLPYIADYLMGKRTAYTT